MTKELFVEYAQEAGLVVISQTIISWSEIEHLDCISVSRSLAMVTHHVKKSCKRKKPKSKEGLKPQ